MFVFMSHKYAQYGERGSCLAMQHIYTYIYIYTHLHFPHVQIYTYTHIHTYIYTQDVHPSPLYKKILSLEYFLNKINKTKALLTHLSLIDVLICVFLISPYVYKVRLMMRTH